MEFGRVCSNEGMEVQFGIDGGEDVDSVGGAEALAEVVDGANTRGMGMDEDEDGGSEDKADVSYCSVIKSQHNIVPRCKY